MIQVKNTVKHDPKNGTYGNCHSACFATILGLPIEEVPHFFEEGDEIEMSIQWARIDDFLAGRGLVQGHILYDGEVNSLNEILNYTAVHLKGVPVILGGLSSANCGHSVVVFNGEIFSDPTGSGILGPMRDGYYWLTFFSPKPPVGPEHD